jgi:hypothetical protein
MPNTVDDDAFHDLASLDELEATREQIASYQALLRDLPEIFERKFNERLHPVVDRKQQLIDEKAQLLRQLQFFGFSPQTSTAALSPSATLSTSTALNEAPPQSPDHADRQVRLGWFLGFAVMGLAGGLYLSQRFAVQAPPLAPPQPLPASTAPPGRVGPTSRLRAKIVEQAKAEWAFFGGPTIVNRQLIRTGRTEHEAGVWQRVLTYWREGVLNTSLTNVDDVSSEDHPWSAAFISYVMSKAGAGTQFPSAQSHSVYINQALANRKDPTSQPFLLAHRPADYAPRPGDLICSTDLATAPDVTFENATTYDFYPSRCEIVINNHGLRVDAIGGDLLDAVTLRTHTATAGRLDPVEDRPWLVMLQVGGGADAASAGF